jgi:putative FmdB family regulatory protein
MPLFEYRCNECRRKFSLLVGVTAEKAVLRCPKCGSGKATKLISRIARTPKSEDFDDDLGDLPDDLGDMPEDLDMEEGMDEEAGGGYGEDEDLD